MADEMTKFFGLDSPEGERALDKECRKLREQLWGSDPLLVALGQAIAPKVNARLAELDKELAARKRHPLDAPDREG